MRILQLRDEGAYCALSRLFSSTEQTSVILHRVGYLRFAKGRYIRDILALWIQCHGRGIGARQAIDSDDSPVISTDDNIGACASRCYLSGCS
jgi:hypothetical protein